MEKCNNAFCNEYCFPIDGQCSEVPSVACPLSTKTVKTTDANPKQLQK